MNAQWLGDILLGNFEALRQVQCSRYTAFNLPDPFAPSPHLVVNLLGEWLLLRESGLCAARPGPSTAASPAPVSSALPPSPRGHSRWEDMREPGWSVAGG